MAVLMTGHAQTPGASQEVVVYKNSSVTERPKAWAGVIDQAKAIRQRLVSGRFGGLQGYGISAKVSAKSLDRELIGDQHGFVLKDERDWSHDGWRKTNSTYLWQQTAGKRAGSVVIDLAIPADLKLREVDEVWLDIEQISGLSVCNSQLAIKGELTPYGQGKQPIAANATTASLGNLQELHRFDTAEEEWQPKSYAYLAARELGFPSDTIWRYSQDQEFAVLQRRFDVSLQGAEFLDLLSSTSIERVNLLVSLDGAKPVLLEYFGLPQSLPDGRQGVRLGLRSQLEQRFTSALEDIAANPASHTLQLKEVVVFLPGEASSLVQAKVLRQLTLAGETLEPRVNGPTPFRLPTQRLALAEGRERHRVDARGLHAKGIFKLGSVRLLLHPSAADAACAVGLNGIRAVSLFKGKVPAFLADLDDWARAHGGPFLSELAAYGKFEAPGVLAVLPFSVLATQEQNVQANEGAFQKIPGTQRFPFDPVTTITSAFRVRSAIGKEIISGKNNSLTGQGAAIRLNTAGGGTNKIRRDDELLVIEGAASEITLDWSLGMALPTGSRFYLDVPEGVSNIGKIVLQLNDKQGRVTQQLVKANHAVPLDVSGQLVRSARLIMSPRTRPYSIKLKEAVLFAPQLIGYASAFDNQALPYRQIAKPDVTIVSGNVVSPQPGSAVVMHRGESSRFRTEFHPKLDWFQGLMLNYRMSLMEANNNCRIKLHLEWERGVTERQLCLEQLSGDIDVPVALLTDPTQSLGGLKAVVWELPSPSSSISGSFSTTTLDFHFDGVTLQTAASLQNHATLLTIGGEPVRPFLPSQGGDEPVRYRQSMYLPLSNKWLSGLLHGMADSVKVVDSDLFVLDSIVATPVSEMAWGRWQELTAPVPPASSSPRWPSWLLCSSLLLLAWTSARKAWWSPNKAWLFVKDGVLLLSRLAHQSLNIIGGAFWHRLRWFNIALGIVVVFPGLWLAGRLADDYSGWMVLFSVAVFGWASLRHHSIDADHPVLDSYAHWSLADQLLAGAVLGNALWALGYFQATQIVRWSGLPLLALGYLMLPRFYLLGRSLTDRWPGFGPWLGWSSVMLVLYVLGLILPVRAGENYFFTFGGMAAVLSLRAALLVLEPSLRQLAPAIAEPVYRGVGSLYFSGALIGLAATAFFLSLKLEPVAEQIAVIVYYCLALGTVKEIIALRQTRAVESTARVEVDKLAVPIL